MIDRYVVIDEYTRDKFEKEWQMPYGYNNCFITYNSNEAVEFLDSMKDQGCDVSTFIVEKVSDEGRELYYRI